MPKEKNTIANCEELHTDLPFTNVFLLYRICKKSESVFSLVVHLESGKFPLLEDERFMTT
jgi:hypothetical protein